jgi:type II secretory pathway pseudopilin PulG
MTLLELLILLTIILAIIFVALPTLKPVEVGSLESFARERLRFIYEKERAYYLRNGTYDAFSVLASDENGGPYLDRRFTGEEHRERGILFTGPTEPTEDLLLEAELPDGTRITLDDKGRFRTHKPEPEPEEPAPLLSPEQMLPQFGDGADEVPRPERGEDAGPPPVEKPDDEAKPPEDEPEEPEEPEEEQPAE